MVDYKAKKQKKMDTWWQSDLGQCLFAEEQEVLQSLTNHFYGYYQLQVGVTEMLLPANPRPCRQLVMAPMADVDGAAELLPFQSSSIDTLLLPHLLSFSTDPHQVLREADRVLVADGTLVLCNFNPWSLWGLRRLFSWQDALPWSGSFIGLPRLKDWLALLNFEVVSVKSLMFRPPLTTASGLKRFVGMEQWGKRLWPFFAGAHIIIARKQTIPLTPVTQRWRPGKLFPTGKLASKPITREGIDGRS